MTIRIWNWNRGGMAAESPELRKLCGHTAYVRGLLWHSELPHILFSGSWDTTIRVWNVADARCLHICHEHHADVYGLTLHPQRPFFLVSSSRDTTLRFWIFEDLIRPLLVQAVVRPDHFSELLGSGHVEATNALCAAPGSAVFPIKLYGQASRNLAAALQRFPSADKGLQVYKLIISFFMYRRGVEDLWDLLAILRNEPATGSTANRTVFHERELITCQKSKALEMASQRAQIGVAMKQEERLLKAAYIMLRVGDLRSYCRYTAQAGHWERAICVAPAVSRQFWQELCAEYIDSLSATADIEEVAPFLVVSGQASKLSSLFIDRGELDNAFVVAKADCDGLLPVRESASGASAEPLSAGGLVQRSRLEDVATELARKYESEGEAMQAALCFLAVSCSSRAVHALSKSHEVVLAYVVGDLLHLPRDPILLKLLANCAERDNRWDLAADIWRQHTKGQQVHIPLLAARAVDKAAAQAWCPWTQEQHQDMLRQAQAAGNCAGTVLHAVCLGDRNQAAQVGVEGLFTLFRNPAGWKVSEAREILDPLEALPLQDMSVKDIAGILSCAAYVGLVEAASQGYHELMFPLAQTLRNIITHQNLPFPISLQEITCLEASAISHRDPATALQKFTSVMQDPNAPPHIRQACEHQSSALQQRRSLVEDDWQGGGPGFGKMCGGNLPTCYKRHAKKSVLTNELIKGSFFELEDHKSHISLPDALAWTRVNAFSPLNTGFKINRV